MLIYRSACFAFSTGLRSGPVPTSEVARRAPEARRHHGELGPERPQPRQGHLETGSVLP